MNDSRLHISDDNRYSRLELIGWWDQPRLRAARIMVVGAGALGNEVLKNLALVGIGHVTVVDFDSVENSNLSRSVLFRSGDAGQAKARVAAEAVRQMNPDVEVRAITGNVLTDIGLGLVREMDLVIGCLDNREARLWVNRMCWKVSRTWIDGGIQEINGVAKVFVPPDGACYECGMTDADYRLIQMRYSCPLLSREDMMQGKTPTAPTIASIIGGLQVQEALKILHGRPVDEGAALVFNGVANQFYKTQFQHRDDCLSHETWEPLVSVPLTHACSLKALKQWLGEQGAATFDQLQLDRDLVTELRCRDCNLVRTIMRSRPLVTAAEAICEQCRQPMRPEMEHMIDAAGPLADQPLVALGIPDQDIVHLIAGTQSIFVELSRRQP
jgi:adenylyltransferase/sulfurtransferase